MNEERKDEEQPQIPEVLPVLPLRDIVIFPFMIVPLYVSRERSIKAVDKALETSQPVYSKDLRTDPSFGHRDSVMAYQVGALLAVPLLQLKPTASPTGTDLSLAVLSTVPVQEEWVNSPLSTCGRTVQDSEMSSAQKSEEPE